jgi:hypothetical protein
MLLFNTRDTNAWDTPKSAAIALREAIIEKNQRINYRIPPARSKESGGFDANESGTGWGKLGQHTFLW